MGKTIYKIMIDSDWAATRKSGSYGGSADDLRDGFVHFSAADQVRETAERHYAGKTGLVLLAVDAEALGAALKWEVSRGGALFPHLYGPLPASAVRRAVPLPLGAGGRFEFPELT